MATKCGENCVETKSACGFAGFLFARVRATNAMLGRKFVRPILSYAPTEANSTPTDSFQIQWNIK